MSYDDEYRGGEYDRNEVDYGGVWSGGYRGRHEEAHEYYPEGDRGYGGEVGEAHMDYYDGDCQDGGYDGDCQDGGYGEGVREAYEYFDGVDCQDGNYGEQFGEAYEYYHGGDLHNESSGGGYDQDEATRARLYGNDKDGNVFSQVLSFLMQNKDSSHDVYEQQMIDAHQQLYGRQAYDHPYDANFLGAGAAMQAFKIFTGARAGAGRLGSQKRGNSQSELIGMAMALAGKLFDHQTRQGNVAKGANKQSAINTAANLALQLYMRSQGQSTGGKGVPGGLMRFASKAIEAWQEGREIRKRSQRGQA